MTRRLRRPVFPGTNLLPIAPPAPAAVLHKYPKAATARRRKFSLCLNLFVNLCVFVFLWLFPGQRGYCGEKPPEAKPGMHRAADGKLYVPGTLPVTLSFSAGGDRRTTDAPAWKFTKEGKQLLTAGGHTGPPVEIYVDLTPPRTRMNFSGAPGHHIESKAFYGRGLVFSAAAHDKLSGVQALYLSVNGGPYAPFDGNYRQFTPDAPNRVAVLAFDNVGNREEVRTRSFFLDHTPPPSAHTVTGPSFNTAGGPVLAPGCTLSLSAADAASGLKAVYYRLDGGPEKKYRKPLRAASMTPGAHRLTWYAEDKVNNREEPHRFDFQYDKEPPAVSLEVEGPKHLRDGTVFISGTAKLEAGARDNLAGTASIHYRIDSGENILYKEPILLPRQSGRHKVDLWAEDKVTNRSTPLSRHFYLDMSPPESSYKIGGFYTRAGGRFIIRKEVTVQLIAADIEAGVRVIRYRVNGGPTRDYTVPFNYEKDGGYKLEYWAEDNIGNVEKPKTLDLLVDTAPAQAGFHKPPARYPKQWYRHPDGRMMGSTDLPFFLYLGLTGKDGKTIGEPALLDLRKLGLDNGKPITFDKGGANTLTIDTGMRRKDGKNHAQSFQVLIDALPPRTSVSFSHSKKCNRKKLPCYGPGLEISFSAADLQRGIVSGFKETLVSVDDSEFFTYTAPLRIFSREKTYRVEYFSVDHVGNAEKPRLARFTVDATPPVTTREVGGPRSGIILSARSVITLNAGDNLSGVKTVYYTFDGGKERVYRAPLTGGVLAALPEGKHSLRYFAEDHTGNREDPRAMSFLLDHGGPAVRMTVMGEQHTGGNTLYLARGSKIRFSASDPSAGLKQIRYRTGSGPAEVYTKPLPASRAAPRCKLYYNGEDNSGNTSPWQQRAVVVDKTPPVTQLTYDGPVFRDKFRFYAGPRTGMVLAAGDEESGVRHTLCSVDKGPFKTITHPFHLKRGGTHNLRFRSADNVGNTEKTTSKNIYIDNTPPVLSISYNLRSYRTTEEDIPVYPAGLIISVTASDNDTEVDKLLYRIKGDRERLYRNPLSDFRGGRDITITFAANDRLGNRAEHKITFRVDKGEL